MLIPVQPWLALTRPKLAEFHGAACRNSPDLVIRIAYADLQVVVLVRADHLVGHPGDRQLLA